MSIERLLVEKQDIHRLFGFDSNEELKQWIDDIVDELLYPVDDGKKKVESYYDYLSATTFYLPANERDSIAVLGYGRNEVLVSYKELDVIARSPLYYLSLILNVPIKMMASRFSKGVTFEMLHYRGISFMSVNYPPAYKHKYERGN